MTQKALGRLALENRHVDTGQGSYCISGYIILIVCRYLKQVEQKFFYYF